MSEQKYIYKSALAIYPRNTLYRLSRSIVSDGYTTRVSPNAYINDGSFSGDGLDPNFRQRLLASPWLTLCRSQEVRLQGCSVLLTRLPSRHLSDVPLFLPTRRSDNSGIYDHVVQTVAVRNAGE